MVLLDPTERAALIQRVASAQTTMADAALLDHALPRSGDGKLTVTIGMLDALLDRAVSNDRRNRDEARR